MRGMYFKRMHKIVCIGIALIGLVGCKTAMEPFNKKSINNTEFKEAFETTEDEPRAKLGIKYYWFKSRKVHATQSDYSGELLNGQYTKYYYSNQLAEKGKFNKGKKTGTWKSWYDNGALASRKKYANGRLSGRSVFLDTTGQIISTGKYSKGKRSGVWLFPQKGDTISYHKGKERIHKEKDTLNPGFFGKLFKKKEKEALNREKKPNFFKRLFSKKENKKAVTKTPKQSNKKQTTSKKSSGKAKTKHKKRNKVKSTKKPEQHKKPNFFQRLFAKKEKKNA